MKTRGFTLIEILIAVFILGIVLSTVYASYTGTLRTIRTTETDAEIYSVARKVMDRMTRDLEATAPWKGAITFSAKSYSLSGRAFTRLIFRSTAHIAFSEKEAQAGSTVIEYDVAEETGAGEKGYILTRSDSLNGDPDKETAPTGGFLLCDRVETLAYRFFDDKGKAYDLWNSAEEAQKNRAPAVVEIRLGLANEKDPERPFSFMTRVRLPLSGGTTP